MATSSMPSMAWNPAVGAELDDGAEQPLDEVEVVDGVLEQRPAPARRRSARQSEA